MPFGIDPVQVKQVVSDVADIKAKLVALDAKIDAALALLTQLQNEVNNHGNQTPPIAVSA